MIELCWYNNLNMPYFFKNVIVPKCMRFRIRNSDSIIQMLANHPRKEPSLLTVHIWTGKTLFKLDLDKEFKSTMEYPFVIQTKIY